MVERQVVLVSNRGPLTFREGERGELVGRRGSGGLVSGLAPLVEAGRATWIAAAMGAGDRRAVSEGRTSADGLDVTLLALDEQDQRRYYDVIGNGTLWFLHHGLFTSAYEPSFTADWWESWAAYRRVNRAFADAVADHAEPGAIVLVQDYHLTLVAAELAERRSDLTCIHFHHTPFASSTELELLPEEVRAELLHGLAAHRSCGFHTQRWAGRFATGTAAAGVGVSRPFVAPLGIDRADLERSASAPATVAASARIEAMVGDRSFVVRVDRMELSKNLVRGFAAYDELLAMRPDLRGRVVFGAFCYPSRENVPEYAEYRRRVESTVDEINQRWGTADWQPILLDPTDDYPRSVAALQRADVLLVNPVRDGLNLVAKEGAVLNRRHAAVVLSSEAGVAAEIGHLCDTVHPYDVSATARALGVALDRPASERRHRATALAEAAARRSPADWLNDQLAAAHDPRISAP